MQRLPRIGHRTVAMADRLGRIGQHLGTSPPATRPTSTATTAATPLRITEVDSFVVECPLTAAQAKVMAEGRAAAAAGDAAATATVQGKQLRLGMRPRLQLRLFRGSS